MNLGGYSLGAATVSIMTLWVATLRFGGSMEQRTFMLCKERLIEGNSGKVNGTF
jgi:hypothetical protein